MIEPACYACRADFDWVFLFCRFLKFVETSPRIKSPTLFFQNENSGFNPRHFLKNDKMKCPLLINSKLFYGFFLKAFSSAASFAAAFLMTLREIIMLTSYNPNNGIPIKN